MKISYADPADPFAVRAIIDVVERLSGRRRLEDLCRRQDPSRDFFEQAVELLRLRLVHESHRLAAIPATGPVVMVANHPFGVVDGIALSHLLGSRRRDFRVIAHGLLSRAPEAARRIIPIDFSLTREARNTNLETRRRAEAHLADGGAVLVFPAGCVASAPSLFSAVVDEPWRPFTARLIMKSRATVVPVFTEGRNSLVFQLANLVHPALRAAMLLNEVRNKIGHEIRMHIGQPLPFDALSSIRDRQELMDSLRLHTLALGNGENPLPGDGHPETGFDLGCLSLATLPR
ncbi:MAG: lysophospholipid acyltransferase family protein [Geminicoccaceae bacterium]|nr:lysophospholipid acyltransferase family protein [Geminicoccaceae bacterium]